MGRVDAVNLLDRVYVTKGRSVKGFLELTAICVVQNCLDTPRLGTLIWAPMEPGKGGGLRVRPAGRSQEAGV